MNGIFFRRPYHQQPWQDFLFTCGLVSIIILTNSNSKSKSKEFIHGIYISDEMGSVYNQ